VYQYINPGNDNKSSLEKKTPPIKGWSFISTQTMTISPALRKKLHPSRDGVLSVASGQWQRIRPDLKTTDN
jgi:hypothetical protein